jgi:hypothetical protein
VGGSLKVPVKGAPLLGLRAWLRIPAVSCDLPCIQIRGSLRIKHTTMKSHISFLALTLTAAFTLVTPLSVAEEKKSSGGKLGDVLRKADDIVNGPARAEEERRRAEEERRKEEEKRKMRAAEEARRGRAPAEVPAERSRKGAEEAVYFKGRITSVDPRRGQFRATGSLPGVFSVTDATRITKENASARLDDFEKGDEVTGTARRTGEDTFQALSVKAAPQGARRPGEAPVEERSPVKKRPTNR